MQQTVRHLWKYGDTKLATLLTFFTCSELAYLSTFSTSTNIPVR